MNKDRKPTEIPASLKTINLEAILRKRGIYFKQRVYNETKAAVMPLARQMVKDKKKVKSPEPKKYLHFSNEDALAYWEKQIHIVEILEKKFDQKVHQFIIKMVDGFLQTIDSEITTKQLKKSKGYFDDNEDELLTKAQLDFTPLLIDQAVLAGQEAYKLIGHDDVYLPTEMRKKVAANVDKFTHSMIDTDKQKLIDIINDGLNNGLSVPDIRKQIVDDFDEYSKMQAQRITRTEVLRASVDATLDAYEQSGVVEGKQWLTAGADDECADYEGEIETLDGNFYSSDNEFQDGDPPLHPNCRCVLLPVLVDQGKAFVPQPNKEMRAKIIDLEDMLDKRTKEAKELMSQRSDDAVYIKSLEKHLGIADESQSETE